MIADYVAGGFGELDCVEEVLLEMAVGVEEFFA